MACVLLGACSVASGQDLPAPIPAAVAPSASADVAAQLGPYALAGALGWRTIGLLDRALQLVDRGLAFAERMLVTVERVGASVEDYLRSGRDLIVKVQTHPHPIPPVPADPK